LRIGVENGYLVTMSNPAMQPIPPAAAAGIVGQSPDNEDENDRAVVGGSDAAADAARSGADVDLSDADRDSDGVPVGEDDLQADIDRSSHD
jgi:hypothetical protein